MNRNEYRIRELQLIISALKGSHPKEAEKYEKELRNLLDVENNPTQLDTY